MEKQNPQYVTVGLQMLYLKENFSSSDEKVIVNRFHNYIDKCKVENETAFPFIDEELILNIDTMEGILYVCGFDCIELYKQNKLVFIGNKMNAMDRILLLLEDMLAKHSYISVMNIYWDIWFWVMREVNGKVCLVKEYGNVENWEPVKLEKL